MNLKYKLNKIRDKSNNHFIIQQKFLYALLPFGFGLIMGLFAKYIEDIPHIGHIGGSLNILGNILTGIGIWVFFATVISVWSRTPKAGALHVFAFFTGMLLAYYIYSYVIFHFFPTYYFLRWGSIALVSPILAYIVWYGRGNGWLASLCASLPIGLLLATGYSFYYTFSISQGLDLFSAVLLYTVLPTQVGQRLRLIPLITIVFLIITKLNVISIFFGWI